ncbi:unnamed protein product [Camellia sinensis]
MSSFSHLISVSLSRFSSPIDLSILSTHRRSTDRPLVCLLILNFAFSSPIDLCFLIATLCAASLRISLSRASQDRLCSGVEVKAGQPLKVTPQLGKVIHISQGALGKGKKEKGNDLIPLRVKINGEKFVVGSLSAENFPQVTFDLVFEKDFELSHDWKNGSVYFCGYSADNPFVYPSNSFLIMLNFMCLQIIIFFIINV